MFDANYNVNFVAGLQDERTIKYNRRSCHIGRIVTTCKYLDDPEILSRLNTTVEAIEKILYVTNSFHIPSFPFSSSHYFSHFFLFF